MPIKNISWSISTKNDADQAGFVFLDVACKLYTRNRILMILVLLNEMFISETHQNQLVELILK